MELSYASRKLAKQCESDRSRKKAFGPERARRLGRRLSALLAAPTLEDLRHAPGRLHALTGDLAGRLSLDLDGPYRLLFEPISEAGGARVDRPWDRVTHVRILAVADTHE